MAKTTFILSFIALSAVLLHVVEALTTEESCFACCEASELPDEVFCKAGCVATSADSLNCEKISQSPSQDIACEHGKSWALGTSYLNQACDNGVIVETESKTSADESALSAFTGSTTGLAVISVGSAACIAAIAVVYRVSRKSKRNSHSRKPRRGRKSNNTSAEEEFTVTPEILGESVESVEIDAVDDDDDAPDFTDKKNRLNFVLEYRDSDSDNSVLTDSAEKYKDPEYMKDPDAIDAYL